VSPACVLQRNIEPEPSAAGSATEADLVPLGYLGGKLTFLQSYRTLSEV
jgi:hypothetical protein